MMILARDVTAVLRKRALTSAGPGAAAVSCARELHPRWNPACSSRGCPSPFSFLSRRTKSTGEVGRSAGEKDGADERRLVYEGPLGEAMRRVKMLSLSGLGASLGAVPVSYYFAADAANMAGPVAIPAAMLTFSAFTTMLLHWFSKPYIMKMYKTGGEEIEVETMTLLLRRRRDIIHLKDVGPPPDTLHPLSTFGVRQEEKSETSSSSSSSSSDDGERESAGRIAGNASYYFDVAARFQDKELLERILVQARTESDVDDETSLRVNDDDDDDDDDEDDIGDHRNRGGRRA